MSILPTGTAVVLDDPDYGPCHGRVVVCLCKRHAWQREREDTECGHVRCGYAPAPAACPWPLHVVWDNGNESHQSAADLMVGA